MREHVGVPTNCMLVRRTFKCDRGLKTHVHMVHSLAVVAVTSRRQRVSCTACGSTFRDQGKLDAHLLRAHGGLPAATQDERNGAMGEHQQASAAGKRSRDETLDGGADRATHAGPTSVAETPQLDVAATQQSAASGEHVPGGNVCQACGFEAAGAEDLKDHFEWLVPRDDAVACLRCGKRCADARALQQHAAACRA